MLIHLSGIFMALVNIAVELDCFIVYILAFACM